MKITNLSEFQSTDREQCGLLIQNGEFITVMEVHNYHQSPESYLIKMSDVELVIMGLAVGEKLIGFFHTHLPNHDPRPSDDDFDGATLFPDMQNVVYHPATGSLIWYGDLAEVLIEA